MKACNNPIIMTMKAIKYLFHSVSIVCAVCTMMAVSCEEPEPPVPAPDPVFPSLVENNDVAAGSVLSLSFEAVMDWTVTVPSENLQWFWIEDSSFKVDKLSGKVATGDKQNVTVFIGVSETEEFDTNRSCEVTLTMGGKSQVVARYLRPAKDRSISVYAAKVEEGSFVMNASGGYEYESTSTESVNFRWSPSDADFRMPVKVEANCEWTVEVPEWLDVQVPESTMGSIEVILTGSSVEDASGRIVFKAGDLSLKELAVNVPACGVVDVYPVTVEDEYFVFDNFGDYLYSSEPSDEVSLIWTGSDFRLPIRVDAKCDWEMEMPEWLLLKYSGEVPYSNSGVQSCVLMGNPLLYPLEDTTDKIVFSFDGQTVKEITVMIPGCKDRFGFGLDMNMTSWKFNPEGWLQTSAGFQDLVASAWISGTEKACVHVVEIEDGRSNGKVPGWLQVEVQSYVDGAEVLQQRSVAVRPSINDGKSRSAYLIFSNGETVDEFFDPDGTLKPEKEGQAILVDQYGADMDYVMMLSSQDEMIAAGVTFEETDNPRLTTWFGQTDFLYELTYSNVYARDKATMSFAKPYASYKVYNSARQDVTSDNSFWLNFNPGDSQNLSGVIDMYMGMTPSETRTTGYVVFYDAAGSTLAVIVAVFDPSKVVDVEVNVEFIGESANNAALVGATLEIVTEDTDKELYDIHKEYMVPIYHLTYRTIGIPMRISVPPTAVKYNPNPYSKRHNFVINGLDYDETVGEFSLIDGGVDVYMFPDEGSNYERGHIFFHTADNTVLFVLVCTLDLTE